MRGAWRGNVESAHTAEDGMCEKGGGRGGGWRWGR